MQALRLANEGMVRKLKRSLFSGVTSFASAVDTDGRLFKFQEIPRIVKSLQNSSLKCFRRD